MVRRLFWWIYAFCWIAPSQFGKKIHRRSSLKTLTEMLSKSQSVGACYEQNTFTKLPNSEAVMGSQMLRQILERKQQLIVFFLI